jgi:hypothetical protein
MEPYFGCWTRGKFDNDRDVFMNLVIFWAREVEPD